MSGFQSQHKPSEHRSSRSTPAVGVSPLAAPGEPGGVSAGPAVQRAPEGPIDPEPATAVPTRTSNSQEDAHARPSSGLASYTALTNRESVDIDPSIPPPPQNNSASSLNPARSSGPWVGPFVGSIIAVLFYRFIKTLEYEMANPGADSDDVHPSKIHEKIVETAYVKASPSVAPSSHI
ncbi:unnamed protein product [Clonostachys chloroleuca]|uniref:Uncharacterized protein n=1 Tax=Clonostachys chloroleuca TaxID=1926264 RepID=A0AA35PTF5_9HYPO|nr:unnamed protein product [Clonostachys chloroleuca]